MQENGEALFAMDVVDSGSESGSGLCAVWRKNNSREEEERNDHMRNNNGDEHKGDDDNEDKGDGNNDCGENSDDDQHAVDKEKRAVVCEDMLHIFVNVIDHKYNGNYKHGCSGIELKGRICH